ncbi:MAG: hypothetical protein E3K37_13855 [Candidatus Kuenenia sp.]|nr:hypothetical protein [Candidatus Kuenenia hertensis]
MSHFSFSKGKFFIIPIFVLNLAGGVGFAKELITSPRDSEFLISAKTSFEYYCSPCHGKDGDGRGTFYTIDLNPKPRDFTDAKYMATRSESDLTQSITGGTASIGKSNLCPPWGNVFTEERIKELVAYIKGLSVEETTQEAVAEKESVVEEEKSPGFKSALRWLFIAVITVALAGGAISEWKKLKSESA